VNVELERVGVDTVVAYFKNWPEETEEDHENLNQEA
jgi:hypothetical protein